MRLFIAVQFSDEVKDKLCETIDKLRRTAVRGNYTQWDNLHLTLVFIGETGSISEIKQAMETVQAQPFTLDIGGIGRFRRNGGDIYWVGVKPSDRLLSVYQQLTSSLTASGFSLESRAYKPHLTLGREIILPEGCDISNLEFAAVSMPVQTIHLMKSERINGKLIYTSIYKKEL